MEAFIADPAIYPSIRAKNYAMVYDFISDGKKPCHQPCIILDLPGADKKTAAEYFCYAINNGNFRNIKFSLGAVKSDPRMILTGKTEDILSLVNQFYHNN